jgi:acetylornithine deacetylase/succinyl-diaminopimelate desuccinylase-like protein
LEEGMKEYAVIPLAFLLLASTVCMAQPTLIERRLPADFGEEAYKHIEFLYGLGDRMTGTEGERSAADYVRNQFEALGISAKAEPFILKAFVVDDILLHIGGKRFEPKIVCFNPYDGVLDFEGDLLLLNPDVSNETLAGLNLEDRSVLTAEPVNHFSLMPKQPKLIVYLERQDYERLEGPSQRPFKLKIKGRVKEFKSANIVGVLSPHSGAAKEVILTAHYDSYHSPGADDNASGVGVLIELARFFKTIQTALPARMKFIALGAEEVGGLGSRIYVKQHERDLGTCELVINMDVLGGSGSIVVEMVGGVSNAPEFTGKSRLPAELRDAAWEGINGRWRLLPPPEVLSLLMGTTSYPDWLVKAIEESVEELGYDVTPTGPLGGDSMFFAEAGITATSIGVMGNVTNSPLDTIDNINKESLKKAGDIVAAVVLKTLRRPLTDHH